MLNAFYIFVEAKREKGQALFRIRKVYMSQKFSFEKFLQEIETGNVYCDFDARTHHNHGTHFRVRENRMPFLYETTTEVV
ncbi:hypothetical protein FACS189419_04540 [Planctomycetales bacterium]|nr:hypothetical protein FACS189419_04540 [Planctomycetales bacterium]